MPVVPNPGPETLDDVYVILTNPPQAIQGTNTSAVGLVGTCIRGIPGAVYNFSSYPQIVQTVGPSSLSVTGPVAMQNLVRQKCGDIYFVPVFGQGGAAATVTLEDSSSTAVLTLTFADPDPETGVLKASFGTYGNGTKAVTAVGTEAGTFNLTVTSPDGRRVDTFLGLTPGSAAAVINASAKTCIAADGTSTNVPADGTFSFSGGTQGAATVDADYVGTTDTSGNKTGLAALETVGDKLSFVLAAEQSSAAINAAVQSFGSTYNCIPVICQPQGTASAAAITAMSTYSQKGLIVAYPWQTVYDPDIGQNRVTAPTSFVAGEGAALGPEQSLGNKPVVGSIGTDVKLSPQDIKNLVAANIMVVGVSIPAGGIGIRNGQDTTGVQVFVARMQYFLSTLIENAIGPYVDELQSTDPNDPLRRWVTSSIQMNLQSLMGNPAQGVIGQIDNYSVVSNLTNNTPQTIADDEMYVDVSVNLLSNAGRIYVRANIGQGVQITSSAA